MAAAADPAARDQIRAPAATRAALAPGAGVTGAVSAFVAWGATANAHVSATVIDVATGALSAAADAHRLMNPASNTKILTVATVLDRLGPDFHFTTGLFGNVENGTVSSLVLRGDGDPSLDTARLLELARALPAEGVRHVDGILVDQSRFDDHFVPPAFGQQPDEWAPFRAPVSAVSLDRNSVTLDVAPRKVGTPATVWFDPPGFVDVLGSVATHPGQGDGVRFSLSPKGDHLSATVAGFVGESSPRLRFAKRVDDPRLFPGYALAALLRDLGVDVRGSVALGGGAARRRIAYVESPALSVLVRELGKNSDNFYAETLLKALGAAEHPGPARTEDGAATAIEWLKEAAGALEPGTRIVNGSGLFDANRLTTFELATALRVAYVSPRIGPDFVAQLAVGGVDGTLYSRFRSLAGRRVVRAKTGTLDDVVALSGYVLAPPGVSPLAFSFIAEGVTGRHHEARARIDRAVESLAATLWK